MMDINEIRAKILQLLETEILHTDSIAIQDDDYLEEYGFDSFAFVKMIMQIEQEFNIVIPNEFLIFSNWSTLNKVCDCVLKIVE